MFASPAGRALFFSRLYFALAAVVVVVGGLFVPVPGSMLATAWFLAAVALATVFAWCGMRARETARRIELRRNRQLIG